MNRHFSDAWYYLKRAGSHLRSGVAEEFAPVGDRVRKATGREKEPEPKRMEKVQKELRRAEGRGKDALKGAKGRIDQYREDTVAANE
ncbi:hypothetical protein SAMN04487948_104126 [Halogranum amylolyticum]|uniref:Uncharacterized protein n=1 Tax=Halogranum amylolyticum TaxID=660520 RepID=A0A1H8RMP7_9EURY|nr:hypothetical protein [Halogranum amylolyticum]SEO67721.1 hypothetical protein SAMN04487948_104126 [Halogranum amylolyticum]